MNRRTVAVGLFLSLPAAGAVADLVSRGARHTAVRTAAHVPERAVLDPNHERELPLVSKAAATAYEEAEQPSD